MKFTKMTDDLEIISKLGDNPGTDNGLSAEDLKAKFDAAGLLLKAYLNGTLLEELNNFFTAESDTALNGLEMHGIINMRDNAMVNLKDPVNEQDALNLRTANNRFVPKTRTVNGKPLSNDVVLEANDVGVYPEEYVPKTRKVNGKPLSSDIQLDLADVGFTPSDYVPSTRTVNGKPLSENVVLEPSDVGVFPENYVPKGRTVNGKSLASNVMLTAEDVGAYPADQPIERPLDVLPASGTFINLDNIGDAPLHSLKLYGKTTQDGTPTPEAPVELVSAGASGAINTTVCGKNLFGGDALADKLMSEAQATKDEENGTVQFTASLVDGVILFRPPKQNTQYTIILFGMNSSESLPRCNIAFTYTDGTWAPLNFKTAGELSYCVATTNANKQLLSIVGANNIGKTTLCYDKCGIFEGVLTEADFEPYVGHTLTASTVHKDGTPNGLHGIPVSSGGDYTDENGQQWVCDEIDFARGVYVHRVGSLDLGTLNWKADAIGGKPYFQTTDALKQIQRITTTTVPNAFCTRYPIHTIYDSSRVGYDNISWYWVDTQERTAIRVYDSTATDAISFTQAVSGAVVQFVLHEPTETALSAEELAQYAALRTVKPNTTVYNDAGAYMDMEYYTPTSALPISGGSLGGNLSMAGNMVTNLGAPVYPGDAVSFEYAKASFAPAGFGLGERTNKLVTDLNAETTTGWFLYQAVNTVGNPLHYYGGAGFVSATYHCIEQVIFPLECGYGTKLRRCMYPALGETEYGEWEWIDPPMELGEKYRTTERYMGKPVYVQLIDCGPTATGTIDTEIPNVFSIDVSHYVDSNGWYRNIDDWVKVSCQRGVINITKLVDYFTASNTYVLLKYTQ